MGKLLKQYFIFGSEDKFKTSLGGGDLKWGAPI